MIARVVPDSSFRLIPTDLISVSQAGACLNMSHTSLHESAVFLSFFASIFGILLALKVDSKHLTEVEDTDRMLMLMTFAYWLTYCISFGLQHLISSELELIFTPIRLTGVLAYLLTFTCALSLPLHKVAMRQVEKS